MTDDPNETDETDSSIHLLHVVYEYMGDSAEEVPTGVTHVRIDSSASEIRTEAFFQSHHLCEVDLSNVKRLDYVGSWAFYQCYSLRKITFPPSVVQSIDEFAFYQCHNLVFLQLPDGLRAISAGVFAGCHSLTHVALPSTLTHIKGEAFSQCKNLVSLELPMELESIGHEAFVGCSALKNLVIPSHATVRPNAFRSCHSLVSAIFPDENQSTALHQSEVIILSLQKRLENQFIHQLCYYQSYNNKKPHEQACLSSLLGDDDGSIDSGSNLQDLFGMTPFHILALSTKPNLNLFQSLLSYEGGVALCRGVKDRWGNKAMEYLCQNHSVDSIFWRDFLLSLLKDRIHSLGLEKWRVVMLQSTVEASAASNEEDHYHASRKEQIRRLDAKLSRYERMEAMSLLELVLWKTAIESATDALIDTACTTTTTTSSREACRVNSGAGFVISQVFPFLETLNQELL
jgi:hypothetical protein